MSLKEISYFEEKLEEFKKQCLISEEMHDKNIEFYNTVFSSARERLNSGGDKINYRDYVLIVVAHITDVLPYFLYMLSKIAPITAVIPKGSQGIATRRGLSAHNQKGFERFHTIKNLYQDILYTGPEIKRAEEVSRDYIQELLNDPELASRSLVVCDHGGYFAKILNQEFLVQELERAGNPTIGSRIAAITEHTKNGDEQYDEAIRNLGTYDDPHDATLPSVRSIATSPLKMKEAKPVGKSIVKNIESIMINKVAGFDLNNSFKVLIVGYGDIGRSIALCLAQELSGVNNIMICEKNEKNLAQAKRDLGGLLDSRKRFFEDISQAFDEKPYLVIMAAGPNTVDTTKLQHIRNEVFFAFATSIDDIFDDTLIKELSDGLTDDGVEPLLTKCNYNNQKLYFLLDGRTVNFNSGSTNQSIIHGVFAYDAINVYKTILSRKRNIEFFHAHKDISEDHINTPFISIFGVDLTDENNEAIVWTDKNLQNIREKYQLYQSTAFIKLYKERLELQLAAIQEGAIFIEDKALALKNYEAERSINQKIGFSDGELDAHIAKGMRENKKYQLLLKAEAVCGKTRFCKKILEAWSGNDNQLASLKEKIVFWLPLHYLKDYLENLKTPFSQEQFLTDYILFVIKQLNIISDIQEGDRYYYQEIIQSLLITNQCFLLIDSLEELEYLKSLEKSTVINSIKSSLSIAIQSYSNIATSNTRVSSGFHQHYQQQRDLQVLTNNLLSPLPILGLKVLDTLLSSKGSIECLVANLLDYCLKKRSPTSNVITEAMKKYLLETMSYNAIFKDKTIYVSVTAGDIKLKLENMEINDINDQLLSTILYSLAPILGVKKEANEYQYFLNCQSLQLGLAASYLKRNIYNLAESGDIKVSRSPIHRKVFELSFYMCSDAKDEELLSILSIIKKTYKDDPALSLILLMSMYRYLDGNRREYMITNIKDQYSFDVSNVDSLALEALSDEYGNLLSLPKSALTSFFQTICPDMEIRIARRLIIRAREITFSKPYANHRESDQRNMLDQHEAEDKWSFFGGELRQHAILPQESEVNAMESSACLIFQALCQYNKKFKLIAHPRDLCFYEYLLIFSALFPHEKEAVFMNMLRLTYKENKKNNEVFRPIEKQRKVINQLAYDLFIGVAYNHSSLSAELVNRIKKSSIYLLSGFIITFFIKDSDFHQEYKHSVARDFADVIKSVQDHNQSINKMTTALSLLFGIVRSVIFQENNKAFMFKQMLFIVKDMMNKLFWQHRSFVDVMFDHPIKPYLIAYGVLVSFVHIIFFALASFAKLFFLSGSSLSPATITLTNVFWYGAFSIISYYLAILPLFIFSEYNISNLSKLLYLPPFLMLIAYIVSPLLYILTWIPVEILPFSIAPSYFPAGNIDRLESVFHIANVLLLLIPALRFLISPFLPKTYHVSQRIENYIEGIEFASLTTSTFTFHLMVINIRPQLFLEVFKFLLSVTQSDVLANVRQASDALEREYKNIKNIFRSNANPKESFTINQTLPMVRHHLGMGGYFFEDIKAYTKNTPQQIYKFIFNTLDASEAPKRGAAIYLFLIFFKNKVEKTHSLDEKEYKLFTKLLVMRKNEIDLICILIDVAISVLLDQVSTDNKADALNVLVGHIYRTLSSQEKAAFLESLQSIAKKNVGSQENYHLTHIGDNKYRLTVNTILLFQPLYVMKIIANKLKIEGSQAAEEYNITLEISKQDYESLAGKRASTLQQEENDRRNLDELSQVFARNDGATKISDFFKNNVRSHLSSWVSDVFVQHNNSY